MKSLYKELSGFVHPPADRLTRILSDPDADEQIVKLLYPEYNENLFEQCCGLSENVVSHVIEMNQVFVAFIQKTDESPQ
jgi:hypothetical protein